MLRILKGETNWSIPVDADGNPYFYYEKIEDVINGDENYIFMVWGDVSHKPTEIEGAKVPFGSRFIDRKTGEFYLFNPPGQWDLL